MFSETYFLDTNWLSAEGYRFWLGRIDSRQFRPVQSGAFFYICTNLCFLLKGEWTYRPTL